MGDEIDAGWHTGRILVAGGGVLWLSTPYAIYVIRARRLFPPWGEEVPIAQPLYGYFRYHWRGLGVVVILGLLLLKLLNRLFWYLAIVGLGIVSYDFVSRHVLSGLGRAR